MIVFSYNQALHTGALFLCLKGGTAVALAQSIFKDPLEIKVNVDTSELDAALAKAEKLVELLKQAQELSAALPPNTTE